MTFEDFSKTIRKKGWFCERVRAEVQEDISQSCRFTLNRVSLLGYESMLVSEESLLTGPQDFSDERNDDRYMRMEKVRRFANNTYSPKNDEFWFSIPKDETLTKLFNRLVEVGGLSWLSTHEHRFTQFPKESVYE